MVSACSHAKPDYSKGPTQLLIFVLLVSVAFAADIYGVDLQETLIVDQRMKHTSKYRDDPELFVQRMQRGL